MIFSSALLSVFIFGFNTEVSASSLYEKDVSGGSNNSTITHYTNINGVLYFLVNKGTAGVELWKSEGTDAFTAMVKVFLVVAIALVEQTL